MKEFNSFIATITVATSKSVKKKNLHIYAPTYASSLDVERLAHAVEQNPDVFADIKGHQAVSFDGLGVVICGNKQSLTINRLFNPNTMTTKQLAEYADGIIDVCGGEAVAYAI